jgi:hypothetical protein
VGWFGPVLFLQPGDVGPDGGIVPMPLEKATHSVAGITEQRAMDEVDGRRRPLDVQEDGAGVLQLDAVRSGM